MKHVPAFLLVLLALPGFVSAQADPATAPASDTPAAPTLSLSLEDAVKGALENHPDIAVEKVGPQIGAEGEREAKGAYDPFLSANVLRQSVTLKGSTAFAGADTVERDNTNFNFGASKLFTTGGTLDLAFRNTRLTQNNVFADFNPEFDSTLAATFTQPLLRNFKLDAQRQQLRVAKRNHEISNAQFEQVVANTVANVKSAYYDLLYSIDNLNAQKKNLGLANQLLGENRIRVRVGTLAPLDVVAAESEVAGREETVIVAEAALADAQDALKRAVLPRNAPDVWTLEIVPTDRPSAEPVAIDVDAAVAKALERRTDVTVARKNLENAQTGVKFAASQKLPTLDLVLSYGTSGIGGTLIEREQGGGPITNVVPGGFGDAFSDVFSGDFPTWSVGVNVAFPLFNRGASARAARAQLSRDQLSANLARLETNVTIEVRSAARAVITNGKRVESTRSSRVLQERRLDAENKRFAAGMSTNFLVTQAQRDLALAEVAYLRAVADYHKSLANFDRVQIAGGGSVTFASLSAVSNSVSSFTSSGASSPAGSGGGASSSGSFGP